MKGSEYAIYIESVRLTKEANATLTTTKELIRIVTRNPFPTYKQLIKSGQLSVSGFMENSATNVALLWSILDVYDEVTIKLLHINFTNPSWEGEFVIQNLSFQTPNDGAINFTFDAVLSGELTFMPTGAVNIYSINFNHDILGQSFQLAGEFITSTIDLPFSYLTSGNLLYQYNTTDTWGSPLLSTASITTFNAYMKGISTGYVRLVTSQTSFYEGGFLWYITYVGAAVTTTSLSIIMPAKRIDQDIVIYTTDFQLTSLTSSEAGEAYRYGVFSDDIVGADWNTLSASTALTSFTALNAALNNTTAKGMLLWFDEGTANTGASTKTITITGTFASGAQQKILSVLDRWADQSYRAALDGNAKIYDDVTDYDAVVGGWTHLPATQATSILAVFTITSFVASGRPIFNTNVSTTHRILAFVDSIGRVEFCITRSGSGVEFKYISNIKCKLGKNVVIITYDGTAASGGTASTNVYINGVYSDSPTVTNTLSGVLNTSTTCRIGIVTTSSSQFLGNIKKLQFLNVNYNSNKRLLRAAYLAGQFDGLVADSEWIMDVDFNQTGTYDLQIAKGVAMIGAITAVADNGGGFARFTTSAITPPGGTVIITNTTSYNTAGAALTRISATQFDVLSLAFVANETGNWRIAITATGGAAYQDFYTS